MEGKDSVSPPEDTSTASPSDRATLLIAVGSASVAFMVGFNYGAFGVIFFEQVFTVWVIATIVFVASIFTRIEPNDWPRRLLLLLPSLWMVLSWLSNNTNLERIDEAALVFTIIVTFVALPFVGWILITTINSDFANLARGNKIAVLAAVGVFLAIGLFLGARNDLVLDCNDFKVSGNDLPTNCVSSDS
ncbi:MAG: hypothetical protein ACR2N9_10385 [Acidimicrobiia bacterium]